MPRTLVPPLVGRVPGVCGDRPIVIGTRVQVTDVLGLLGGGMPEEEVCRQLAVTCPQIRACCAYAAGALDRLEPRA